MFAAVILVLELSGCAAAGDEFYMGVRKYNGAAENRTFKQSEEKR